MITQSVWSRLRSQLDSVAVILADAPEEAMSAPAAEGNWSARDHLAHLGRMHEVLIERLRRILVEADPSFADYHAEEDLAWPQWRSRGTREVVTRLQALRGELLDLVRGLSDDQLRRGGRHPILGPLAVSGWLESFCLHEGHHLHAAWIRLAAAKNAGRHLHEA